MVLCTYVALVRTVTICHRGVTLCSSGQDTTSGLTFYPKGLRSVKCLDSVLGKILLPCWRFIVVRHGGNVHSDVCSILFLICAAADIPINLVQKLARTWW